MEAVKAFADLPLSFSSEAKGDVAAQDAHTSRESAQVCCIFFNLSLRRIYCRMALAARRK